MHNMNALYVINASVAAQLVVVAAVQSAAAVDNALCVCCTTGAPGKDATRSHRKLHQAQPPSPPIPPSAPYPPARPGNVSIAVPVLVAGRTLAAPAFGKVHLLVNLTISSVDNSTLSNLPAGRELLTTLYDLKANPASWGYRLCNSTDLYAANILIVCPDMPPAGVRVVVTDLKDPQVRLYDSVKVRRSSLQSDVWNHGNAALWGRRGDCSGSGKGSARAAVLVAAWVPLCCAARAASSKQQTWKAKRKQLQRQKEAASAALAASALGSQGQGFRMLQAPA